MAQGIIDWVKATNDWEDRQEKNAHDFTTIGEVFGIVRFDYSLGAETEDEQGAVSRLGEFVIDRVFGFDMRRDPNARDSKETRYWIKDTMVDIEDFKILVKDLNPDIDPETFTASSKGTFKIFDSNSGEYRTAKDQTLIMELFYKPSIRYPKGWYALYTDELVVFQGELPFGIYPVVTEGFDELTTSPRSTSIVRVCRPYQVEINRSSSKMAEHQITLGDDKVFIQKGTKISNGGYMHGVRAFQISGQQPIVQAGRSGAQYLEYQLSQIREMYEAANLEHIMQDKESVGDPYQLLFRTMKEKKRFVKYVGKFGRFEKRIFETVLKMSKKYLTPQHIIKINGRSEAVNIPEFVESKDNGFEIKIKPQSGDIETKFGKILGITQTLQYTGGQLNPEQIGSLIRQLPFGNDEQLFSTMTISTDNAMNTILALDRGSVPNVNVNEDHQFMITALNHRMKKSDFRFLAEDIKNNYMQVMAQHEQLARQEAQQKLMIENGMIPTGGFLTTVNASAFNPQTNRVERIKVPSNAIQWLVDKLTAQGNVIQENAGLPQDSQANILTQEAPQASTANLGPQAQGV